MSVTGTVGRFKRSYTETAQVTTLTGVATIDGIPYPPPFVAGAIPNNYAVVGTGNTLPSAPLKQAPVQILQLDAPSAFLPPNGVSARLIDLNPSDPLNDVNYQATCTDVSEGVNYSGNYTTSVKGVCMLVSGASDEVVNPTGNGNKTVIVAQGKDGVNSINIACVGKGTAVNSINMSATNASGSINMDSELIRLTTTTFDLTGVTDPMILPNKTEVAATPPISDNSEKVATTKYVDRAVSAGVAVVDDLAIAVDAGGLWTVHNTSAGYYTIQGNWLNYTARIDFAAGAKNSHNGNISIDLNLGGRFFDNNNQRSVCYVTNGNAAALIPGIWYVQTLQGQATLVLGYSQFSDGSDNLANGTLFDDTTGFSFYFQLAAKLLAV